MSDTPRIENRRDAERVIAKLHERQNELSARCDSLAEGMERKTADLVAAQKTIVEMDNRVKLARTQTDNESAITRYVDGGTVRWNATETPEGARLPGLLDDAPVCDWQREMKDLAQTRSFVRGLTKSGRSPKTDAQIARLMDRAPAPIKRIFSDTSAMGAEFVPDLVSPDLAEALHLNSVLEGLFPQIAMSGKELRLPFVTWQSTPYLKSVPSSDDPSNFTASTDTLAQRSFSAKSLATRVQIDEDFAMEDSIIPVVPMLRSSLAKSIAHASEDAIVNGDLGTHMDNDLANWNPRSRWDGTVGTSADHRRAWIGLRARAVDVSCSTDQNSVQSYAGFLAARGNLDSPHGVGPKSLICVTSPEYYLQKMVGFDEVTGIESYGMASPVVTGELARLGGVPIVISEFVTKDLNTSGVYDHSTKTPTSMLLFNADRFFMGNLRGLTIDMDKTIVRGTIELVCTRRCIFGTVDSSTKKNVHLSYNLS